MFKFLTRRYSFLGVSLMQNAWKEYDRCMEVTGVPDCARDVECIYTDWYLDQTWIEEVSKRHTTAAPGLFRRFLERGRDAGNSLTEVSRDFYENLDSAKAEISQKNLQEFLAWKRLFQENAAFILITHPLAKSVEMRLMDTLGKYGVPAKDFDQMLLELSITRRSNGAEEENFDLFFIQERMSDPDFDLEAALAEHARKHAYLKYRDPFSGGYPVEYFRDRLKTKLSLPDYFLPYADILARFDKNEQEVCELLEEFVFFRTFRTERSYESLYYLERFLTAMEEAHDLEAHELSFYSEDELIRFLETGRSVDRTLVEERSGGFASLMHDAAVSFLTGEAAQRWQDTRREGEDRAVREVRGLTAFRGTAVGRARVVMSAAAQDVVQEGDILVVTMTTPDFLPSMQRAAALVTDEGGVICHAAIIARELKKPCVIGTRKATSVFKDGDLIEVDGFKGVVRLAQN
jgi:phosphohistidine swiveling domain-containing protein